MTRFQIKMIGSTWLAISLGVLSPTESFASLNSLACRLIKNGCLDNCPDSDINYCANQCRLSYSDCIAAGGGLTTKQQNPAPPPCRGIHCSLRPPPKNTEPTAPRRPITTAKPTAPFKPVGNSNPDGPKSGANNPVIYERNSGGSQSGGHESGGGGGHGK